MSILVFGHSGQVATELRRQADVISLDRSACDLADPEKCGETIRFQSPCAVINAAAYTAVDAAEENEELATTVNGLAPTVMAKACGELGIPFLHISTDYVFDGNGKNSWTTSDNTVPVNAYGRSKLVGEKGISQSGCQHVILRTSWVFSSHGNNFVKTMLRLSETRNELNVVGDQFGGPTPAADIAAALLTILSEIRSGNSASGTYHFSGHPVTTWAGFAKTIFEIAKIEMTVTDIPTKAFPTPATRPANSRLDCSSLLRDFGIEQADWKAGLAKVIDELGQRAGI